VVEPADDLTRRHPGAFVLRHVGDASLVGDAIEVDEV
jgi:hypothetical protein